VFSFFLTGVVEQIEEQLFQWFLRHIPADSGCSISITNELLQLCVLHNSAIIELSSSRFDRARDQCQAALTRLLESLHTVMNQSRDSAMQETKQSLLAFNTSTALVDSLERATRTSLSVAPLLLQLWMQLVWLRVVFDLRIWNKM
jgi:hypothetical protein